MLPGTSAGTREGSGLANIAVAPLPSSTARFEAGPHYHLAWGWEWDIRGWAWNNEQQWVQRHNAALGWEPAPLPPLQDVLARLNAPAEEPRLSEQEHKAATIGGEPLLGSLERVASGPPGGPLLGRDDAGLSARYERLWTRRRDLFMSSPDARDTAKWAAYVAQVQKLDRDLRAIAGSIYQDRNTTAAPLDLTPLSVRTCAERRHTPAQVLIDHQKAEQEWLDHASAYNSWVRELKGAELRKYKEKHAAPGHSPRPPHEDLGWYLPKHLPDGLASVETVERRCFEWGLRVTLYDLGPAVVFTEPLPPVAPLMVEWRGMSVAQAFLSLNPDRGDDVASFLQAFGEPPDLVPYQWTGPRWWSVNRLRRLQRRLQAGVASWWADSPGAAADQFGGVVLGPEGPVLQVDLWRAIALDFANAKRGGLVGYCAAPWGAGTCGRAFIAQRKDRRKYCSDSCASRATTRQFRASHSGRTVLR